MADKVPAVEQQQVPANVAQSFTPSETKDFHPNSIASAKVKPAQTLEQWAQSITEPEGSSTVNLSRFGLKNASDVIKFLKSPAGESTIAEVSAQIAMEDAIKKQQQFDQQQHLAMMARLQALLFLWFVDEKSDAEQRIREIVMSDNQKALERGAPKADAQPLSPQHNIEFAISSYHNALDAAYKKQEQLINEEIALADEEDALMAYGEELNEKYDIYNNSLEEFSHSMTEKDEVDKTVITNLLTQLTAELDSHVDKINQIIEIDDDATQLLNDHTALNLKVGSLQDMLAVNQGKKYYANAEGDKVSSFKEADFVLTNEQKIVKDKDTGKYYLMKINQNLDDLKKNPELLQQAEKAYDRAKHEMMSVNKIVLHNKGLEFAMHQERVQVVQNKIGVNRTQQLQNDNQIGVIQSSLTNLTNTAMNPAPFMTKMPDQNMAISSSAPTPGPAIAKTPKPSLAPATTFFRERLQELKQNQNVTRHDLRVLANQAPIENRQAARLYIQTELANLPRKGPIPFQAMQTMLKNLERFGVDTTKPGVTNIEPPTPFKTKPE